MGYFCLKCGEVYRNNIYKTTKKYYDSYDDNKIKNWTHCPKTKCFGQVIETDDMFLPIIRILNQKRYRTIACCSAHIEEDVIDSYIMFKEDIKELPSLPEGYVLENGKHIIIRRNYNDSLNSIELHKLILLNAIKTLEWAESLKKRD